MLVAFLLTPVASYTASFTRLETAALLLGKLDNSPEGNVAIIRRVTEVYRARKVVERNLHCFSAAVAVDAERADNLSLFVCVPIDKCTHRIDAIVWSNDFTQSDRTNALIDLWCWHETYFKDYALTSHENVEGVDASVMNKLMDDARD